MSGIFEGVLNAYGLTLNVGRGLDGWDSIHNAATRWGNGARVTVLFFSDFDPSGEASARFRKFPSKRTPDRFSVR